MAVTINYYSSGQFLFMVLCQKKQQLILI